MLNFKSTIEASGVYINGVIKICQDEDYDPKYAVFNGKITPYEGRLLTRNVKHLLEEIQALYDQMVAIDTANQLEYEENEASMGNF